MFLFYLCEGLNDILNVDDAGQWFPIRCDFTPRGQVMISGAQLVAIRAVLRATDG